MGWFELIFTAGEIGIEYAQFQKIKEVSQLQTYGMVAETIQIVLRNYIFNINNAKEDLLPYIKTNPSAVAAGLRSLELELDNSGVTPALFFQLTDKEYWATTQRNIRQTIFEIETSLTTEQKSAVESAAIARLQIEDLTFIVQTYDSVQTVSEAKAEMRYLEKNKPGVFSFGKQGECNRKYEFARSIIQRLEKQVDQARFEVIWAQHKFANKEDCIIAYTHAMEILQSVFHNVPYPKLPNSEEKNGTTSNLLERRKTALNENTCPKCGFVNSPHRVTCKNCHIALN